MLPVGVGYFFLSIFFISMATLEAQGRPGVVAVAFFIGAWLVCIPLASVEAFVWDNGLLGQWTAIIVGYVITTSIASLGVYFTNWDVVLEQATVRNSLGSPHSPASARFLGSPGRSLE